MNKIKTIISAISTIFPSRMRIPLMNLLGYKINPKARLKIFYEEQLNVPIVVFDEVL